MEKKDGKCDILGVEEAIKKNVHTAFVLAGCHSLVVHEDKMMGDSAEMLFFDSGFYKFDGSNRSAYDTYPSSILLL